MQINRTTIDITAHNPALQIYNVVVDVIRLVKVPGSTGIDETEVVLVSGLQAHIRWRTGRERILFDKTTWFRDATLKCRVQAVTITTHDRIRHNGLDFEIVSLIDVNNLGRRLLMDIRRIA